MSTPEMGTKALHIGPQFNRAPRVRTFESVTNPPVTRERTTAGKTNIVRELVGGTVLAARRDGIDNFLDGDDNDGRVPNDIRDFLLFIFKSALWVIGITIPLGMLLGQGFALSTAWGSIETAAGALWAGKIGFVAFLTAFKVGVIAIASALGTAIVGGAILAGIGYAIYRRFRYGSWFGKKKKK